MRISCLILPAWLCVLQGVAWLGDHEVFGGSGPLQAVAGAQTLTNVADCLSHVRRGSNQTAAVRVEATITLVDRERSLIVVQDDASAMAVSMPLAGQTLRPGQRVVIEGSGIVPYTRVFPAYPDQPSERSILTLFETPSGAGTHYLTRIRGYLRPSVSGSYTFWVAADDGAELWMSADASPEQMAKIVGTGIGNPTSLREWERYPLQRSQPVTLKAGERYYVEALHVQSYGRDCFAVAWEGPGIERTVIETRYLTPWTEAPAGESLPSEIPQATNGLLWERWNNFLVREYDALGARSVHESIVRIPSLRLTVLGEGKLPDPHRIVPGGSLNTVASLQWVELEGDVSFAALKEGGLQLELKQEDSPLGVRILDRKGVSIEEMIHSRVRVRGVLEHAYNPTGALTSSVMWVPNAQQVGVLESQESHSEWLSQFPICEVEPSNPEMRWGRQISVRGRVVQQSTNGLTVVRGGDNFRAYCSADGSNWMSLGSAVEIGMSNSVLGGLAVVSRHDTEQASARFSDLKGWGTNWLGAEIGNPGQAGSFSVRDGILTVAGSGRKIGERGDQHYYLHQSMPDEGEISAQLIDLTSPNTRAQVGLMMRESLDARAPFAAVLFAPAIGPAFQYRRTLGEPVTGFEAKPEYGGFRWLKLVRQKSLLQVQGEPGPEIGANQEVNVTGVLTWQNGTPILTKAFFEPARAGRRTSPAVNAPLQSIASFVSSARHPPEPFLSTRMESPRLSGVVTFCGDFLGEPVMFVQSGDRGGIRLGWTGVSVRPKFEVGQFVELWGNADVRKFPVILQPVDLKLAGWGTLPEPESYASALVKGDGAQAQWVEATGVVRSEATNGVLNLMTKDGPLAVWIGSSQSGGPGNYVDAGLRVRGVLSLDSTRNAHLLVPSSAFVEVQEHAPADPFDIPSFSIAALTTFELKPERLRRMKLGGVVTCALSKRIYLQDDTGAAQVQTGEAASFRPGDRVEVVGFPEQDSAVLSLSGAIIRKVGTGEPPKPIQVSVNELVRGSFAGRLVQLEATLLEHRELREVQLLTLQVGAKVFEASLTANEHERLPPIPPGSRVAITGVGQPDPPAKRSKIFGTEAGPAAASLRLWLPDRDSVTVLERPSWWTIKRAVAVGGMLAFGQLVALLWVRLLRRRVAQRTRELQATMQQLERETRTAAVLGERDRLAAEIHDSLEQGLTAIMLQLDAANKHSSQSPEIRRHVQMARGMAEFSRAEVQHAVWDMQSPLLDNEDLGTALKHLAGQLGTGSPKVSVAVIGSPRPLPSSHEHHLLRIAQEAITNAMKHAQAGNIQVALDYSGSDLMLGITDDGVGFVPGDVKAQGQNGRFGLHGLRARAKKIAAQLEIASQPGKGTTISVRMNLNHEPTEFVEELGAS
jgi:signal transduction histidine kinase